MRNKLGRSALAATGALTIALLAGCAGSSGSTAGDTTSPAATEGPAEDGGLTQIRVGYIPIGVYSYFWRAQDAGYFEDEGLEVELVPMAGGGEILPALQSGSLQFGISDALGVLNARNGGIPATYVSFNFTQTEDSATHAVLTADPEIDEPSDLEGKTVATNLSFNTDWTMMRAWLRENGVDVESVSFQELPFPDMLAGLRNGTVDAAGVAEPFVTVGANDGLTVLGSFFTEVRAPIAFSGVVAMDPYIEENPEIVESFVKAINAAIEDFKADPAVAREVIGEHTEIAPEVIESMGLGVWETDVPASDMEFWIDAAAAEDLLDSDMKVEDLIWSPQN